MTFALTMQNKGILVVRGGDTIMLAVPVFRSRVAPVFNWCSRILILPEENAAAQPVELTLTAASPFDRLRALRDRGVRTIICGALTPNLLSYAENLGMEIVHGIAGELEEVLGAYRARRLHDSRFRLPGCRGQPRCPEKLDARPEKQDLPAPEETPARPGTPLRKGSGVGKGRRPPHGEAGARQGGSSARPGGICVCPQCAAILTHERGLPCAQIRCSHCGSFLVRARS